MLRSLKAWDHCILVSYFSVTTLAKPFRPQAPTQTTPILNSIRTASPQVVSINQGVQQTLPRPQIIATTVSINHTNSNTLLYQNSIATGCQYQPRCSTNSTTTTDYCYYGKYQPHQLQYLTLSEQRRHRLSVSTKVFIRLYHHHRLLLLL